ncbi:hypothetical protein NDU88_004545 [Pleurodeles waltl]|uniref:Uncharacterized protein n=1 Tax=Pleurodeles waltl TaxID=8319 RepID=A0AAV7SJ32_PLEWA|nr:hypothetical protein NDU88_004545 [Pleurodeles waltl]
MAADGVRVTVTRKSIHQNGRRKKKRTSRRTQYTLDAPGFKRTYRKSSRTQCMRKMKLSVAHDRLTTT